MKNFRFPFLALLLLLNLHAHAHVVPEELSEHITNSDSFRYLSLGFKHIIPSGYDHLLFVLGLLLTSKHFKTVLWQLSAFTLAHAFSLLLVCLHLFHLSASITEPLIAASVLWIALENLYTSKLRIYRLIVVFLFGLVHGLGFAQALKENGISDTSDLKALLLFNTGIEAGQLVVVAAAYYILSRWLNFRPKYRKYVVVPVSIAIALAACFLLGQRF